MFYWLNKLGIDTSGFDSWEFFFPGLSETLTWVLLAAAVTAGILWTRSSVKDVPSRPRRILLMFLQSAGLILLVLIMLQPSIRLNKVAKIRDRVHVLFDTSASMTLPAGDKGLSRADEERYFLSKHGGFWDKLEENFITIYSGFDAGVHDFESRPKDIQINGEATDIMGSISSVAGSGAGTPLAGVILVSDGADTRGLVERLMSGNRSGVDVLNLLKKYPAPVNTVFCGGDSSVKDLAITEARHDDYGFVHNPFEVMIKVRSQGDLATSVPVIFKQGERVLAAKTVSLIPGQSEAEALLSFTPRHVGEFMFSVEIPVVSGEITEANNVVRFPLKILRDKVRVLYLVGNPSWDERFLRRTLKKDPSVDLVSFYILREHWDNHRARQTEVSLIPFPTSRLFNEELDTFDLVIWQNFRGPVYMPGTYSKYMDLLNDFVKERGGALLMMGGHRSFFGQGRLDPKLLDLLPVEPSNSVPNYKEGEFKVEVTEAGLRHPIMDVGEGAGDVGGAWSRMPALGGLNWTKRAVPGALVLAEHPYEKGAEANLPVIAVREVGEGRVMAVMTDCSWQWNFVAVGEGHSNKPYQRFWENSLRWLLQDPEMRLISLSADRGRVNPGEPVTIMLEVLDETYQPTDKAEVEVEILEQPEGSTITLPAPERFGVGKYRLVVTPEQAGGYRLGASSTLSGRSLGSDQVIFEAAEESAEFTDVLPRPELLAAISKATGGKAIKASDNPKNLTFKSAQMEQVTGTKDLPLWDNWIVFALCFTTLIAGWYLRRKWGLR